MNDIQIKNTADSFRRFLLDYQLFRNMSGFTKKIDNVHEILTGMTDKHGRICRYIKHQERKDPKSDWPDGMTQALVGYLIYAIMLLEHYGVNIEDGMKKELEEAVKQHRK
jgi:hypothetical protein